MRTVRTRIPGLTREALADAIEEDVDDRGGIEREDLAEKQSAHHGDSQGAPKFRSHARTHGQRDAREQGGHGSHHDGTEAEQAGLINRIV
jgi:hypothetical protein